MISRIEFFISETFQSLRRHPSMAFAAAVCVAATLFVGGIVGLALMNAGYAVDTAISRYRFSVYFKPHVQRVDTSAQWLKIKGMPGVADATFINREDAWKQVLQSYNNDPTFEKALGGNPLPDRVDVRVDDLANIPALQKQIATWPMVDRVTSEDTVTKALSDIRKGITLWGGIAGIILLALSLVIIHHTIELTLYARRKEIMIMGLVGATPATIALPFMLEGIVYGFLGGAVATALLGSLYQYLLMRVKVGYNTQMLDSPALWINGCLAVIVAGMALGLIGALASVIKYLYNPRSKVTNA